MVSSPSVRKRVRFCKNDATPMKYVPEELLWVCPECMLTERPDLNKSNEYTILRGSPELVFKRTKTGPTVLLVFHDSKVAVDITAAVSAPSIIEKYGSTFKARPEPYTGRTGAGSVYFQNNIPFTYWNTED